MSISVEIILSESLEIIAKRLENLRIERSLIGEVKDKKVSSVLLL